MKFNKFLPRFLSSISLLNIFCASPAKPGIEESLKSGHPCPYEKVSYENYKKSAYGGGGVLRSFCITEDKKVYYYRADLQPGRKPYLYVKGKLMPGTIGRQVYYWEDGKTEPGLFRRDLVGYRLSLWKIDGNKLVRYTCATSDNKNCSDKPYVDYQGIKK